MAEVSLEDLALNLPKLFGDRSPDAASASRRRLVDKKSWYDYRCNFSDLQVVMLLFGVNVGDRPFIHCSIRCENRTRFFRFPHCFFLFFYVVALAHHTHRGARVYKNSPSSC